MRIQFAQIRKDYLQSGVNRQHLGRLREYIKTADLAALTQCRKPFEKIEQLAIKNWGIYKHRVSNQIQTLLAVLVQKLTIIPNSSIILPQLHRIIKRFQSVSKHRIPLVSRVSPQPSDTAYMHYAQQLQQDYEDQKLKVDSHSEHQNILSQIYQHSNQPALKSDSVKEGQVKQHQLNYDQFRQRLPIWKELFYKLTLKYKLMHEQPVEITKFKNSIENQTCPNKSCLGCTQFMYENFDIYDPRVSQLDVAILPAQGEIKKLQTLLNTQICAFLNGRGGIILIGCQKEGFEIRAKGCLISESVKVRNKQKIEAYIKNISGSVCFDTHISVDTIPIVDIATCKGRKNNSRIALYKGAKFEQTQFKQGLYVTRIKVFPVSPEKTYFCKISDNSKYFYRIGHINAEFRGNDIYPFMKERFRSFYQSRNAKFTFSSAAFAGKNRPLTHHHEESCQRSLFGWAVYDKEEVGTQPKESQEKGASHNFKYLSLLVVDGVNRDKVTHFLKEKNIQNEIDSRWEKQYRFGKTTSLLFHNKKFDKVLSELKNNGQSLRYNNKAKPLSLISTSPVLQILNNMTTEQLKDAEEVLKKFDPKQNVYELIENHERLLLMKTNIGAVLMYYYLDDKNVKIRFKKVSVEKKKELEDKAVDMRKKQQETEASISNYSTTMGTIPEGSLQPLYYTHPETGELWVCFQHHSFPNGAYWERAAQYNQRYQHQLQYTQQYQQYQQFNYQNPNQQ